MQHENRPRLAGGGGKSTDTINNRLQQSTREDVCLCTTSRHQHHMTLLVVLVIPLGVRSMVNMSNKRSKERSKVVSRDGTRPSIA